MDAPLRKHLKTMPYEDRKPTEGIRIHQTTSIKKNNDKTA